MIVKKHYHDDKLVLAVCDESLVGKIIEENKQVLDLSSEFYKGEKVSDEDLIKLLNRAYIINAVGKKAVEFLIEKKIITEESTKHINKVPYSHVVFEGKKD